MSDKQRILVIAHGHPDFSLGGAEIAAYNLFTSYREHPGVEDAWFLARANRGRGVTGAISMRRENEYLWEQGIGEWHRMKAAHQESLLTWFADLVRAVRPTVVQVHHYVHLGLEFLRVIKRIDPSIRIFMTLHEYIAICANNGQMVKTNSTRLCSRASFDECHQCFPEKSAEDFWLRKHYFQSHFDLVDGFVSPSEFLRQRYIQWGIEPGRITMIENGQADHAPLPPRPLAEGGTRNRFAFFGQITPFKGLDVVLEGLTRMPAQLRRDVVFEVHGANLEQQLPEYRERVQSLADALVDEGVVRWVGPYQPHEMTGRMRSVDWVVVPSIWWENSPMVIQEAFVHGRPLLVSDIGGMAEKVRDGMDGLHVQTGNPLHWAERIAWAAAATDEWDRMVANIVRPAGYKAAAQLNLEWFESAAIHSRGAVAEA